MSANVRDKLVTLLQDYQDIFTWSYQDMPGLSSEIVQHKLPLNPECSPIKKKLRRMKPGMSLKIKEEVKKQFDAGFLVVARYPVSYPNFVQEYLRSVLEPCLLPSEPSKQASLRNS